MKVQKPKHTYTAEPSEVDLQLLRAEMSLENVYMHSSDMGSVDLKNLSFDESQLTKLTALSAQLEKISLVDTTVRHCDFSGAGCAEGSIIRTHFTDSRLIGTDFSRAIIKDVTFERCKLDMANFRFAKLTRVQFIDCTLHQTDFQVAQLNDLTFSGCTLSEIECSQCLIKNVDFRTSTLMDIRGWQYLKGCTIDQFQLAAIAPQLAVVLGLKIAD